MAILAKQFITTQLLVQIVKKRSSILSVHAAAKSFLILVSLGKNIVAYRQFHKYIIHSH